MEKKEAFFYSELNERARDQIGQLSKETEELQEVMKRTGDFSIQKFDPPDDNEPFEVKEEEVQWLEESLLACEQVTNVRCYFFTWFYLI